MAMESVTGDRTQSVGLNIDLDDIGDRLCVLCVDLINPTPIALIVSLESDLCVSVPRLRLGQDGLYIVY